MQFLGTGKRLAPNDVGDAARLLGVETALAVAITAPAFAAVLSPVILFAMWG
jgi:hypothetical protein